MNITPFNTQPYQYILMKLLSSINFIYYNNLVKITAELYYIL